MTGSEVHSILQDIGATHLHHANTVTTSCTFLEKGALLSRDYAERHGLPQTPQSSDAIDKKMKIWDRIFLDHVNIHYRGGGKKGPNQYGPVLFMFPLGILRELPQSADIEVSKVNPIHWPNINKSEWCFQNSEELRSQIKFGDFDKMLIIRTASSKLSIPDHKLSIVLDDPDRTLPSGPDAFTHAKNRLKSAARIGGVDITIKKHECKSQCQCLSFYRDQDPRLFNMLFQ